jgi:hypothetical protein
VGASYDVFLIDTGGLAHGLSESVLLLWIGMLKCTSMHVALTKLVDVNHMSDITQLTDCGPSCQTGKWDCLSRTLEFNTSKNILSQFAFNISS